MKNYEYLYGAHKFVMSRTDNTYNIKCICEYCGLLCFDANSSGRMGGSHEMNKYEARKPCENNIIGKIYPDGTITKLFDNPEENNK